MKRIKESRILQISNNVSEEFADHGETDFATPEEFCRVIQYWQKQADTNWNKYQKLRMELGSYLFKLISSSD